MIFSFKCRKTYFAVFLASAISACGPSEDQSSKLQEIPTIGLNSMWKVDNSWSDGRKQIIYCPIIAKLPLGYFASALAGDCSSLQGGQPSGVTALIAQEIRANDKVLCMVKNADFPSGWKAQTGPFGRVICGSTTSGFQIERL